MGTGKTTLARYFLSKLGPDTHTAFILYPALTADELLRTILDDLHVKPEGESKKSLVDALHRFLLEARAANRNVVLLIDEAQDLSAEVLEQVRLISNLETDTEKLIQIVLMGQSELRDKLARHELRQLAQRVTARYHLSPLSPAETGEYVRHRIVVAGGEGKVGFTSDALTAVHQLSGGVPRLVNLVCDRALLAGYVQSARTITAGMVRQAAKEVAADRPAPAFRWHHGLIATGLTVALAVLAFAVAPRLAQAPEAPAASLPAATPAAPSTPAPPPRSDRLDELLRTTPREASFAAAAARIGTAWGGRVLSRATLRTHLDQLRALDLPAALEMFHPSRRDTCFVALLRLDDRAAVVAAGDAPEIEAPLAQIDALWTRDAVVWWPEPGGGPRRPRPPGGLGTTGARGPRAPRPRDPRGGDAASSRGPASSPTVCSGPARGWRSSRSRRGCGPDSPGAEPAREPHPRRAEEARAREGRARARRPRRRLRSVGRPSPLAAAARRGADGHRASWRSWPSPCGHETARLVP